MSNKSPNIAILSYGTNWYGLFAWHLITFEFRKFWILANYQNFRMWNLIKDPVEISHWLQELVFYLFLVVANFPRWTRLTWFHRDFRQVKILHNLRKVVFYHCYLENIIGSVKGRKRFTAACLDDKLKISKIFNFTKFRFGKMKCRVITTVEAKYSYSSTVKHTCMIDDQAQSTQPTLPWPPMLFLSDRF